MLILTRKKGEVITIGGDIRIQVLAVKGAQVRIGIEAPSDVAIHREDAKKQLHGTAEPFRSESSDSNDIS